MKNEEEIENELKEEIDTMFYEMDLDEQIKETTNLEMVQQKNYVSDCSILIPSVQVNEYILGPYNSLLAKSLNTYIPDLFRKCWLTPGIGIPEICPTINNNNRTIFFNQELIDENILKAFVYFGFSSNIYENYGITVPIPKTAQYSDFELFLKNFYKDLFTENYGNFYDFTNHFFQKYKFNSLFSQLIFFRYIINRAHENTTTGKVNCPYIIPWDATVTCRDFKLYTFQQLKYVFDITLLNNIYTLYNLWLGNVKNIVTGKAGVTNNRTRFAFTDYLQNFFITLLYTGQVFEDVVLEFSYTITKKCYCKRPYMTQEYYNKCLELYQIYIENKKRLSYS